MDLNLSLGVKIEKLGKPLTLGGGVQKNPNFSKAAKTAPTKYGWQQVDM